MMGQKGKYAGHDAAQGDCQCVCAICSTVLTDKLTNVASNKFHLGVVHKCQHFINSTESTHS